MFLVNKLSESAFSQSAETLDFGGLRSIRHRLDTPMRLTYDLA